MEEDAIKLEVRLFALESLFSFSLATMNLGNPTAERDLAEIRDTFLDRSRVQTFPALGPAYSDLVAAELEAAVDRLLKMQRFYRERMS